MTTVVVSDRRTAQVQLALGDSFVLTVDGSISENVAAGVVGFGGNSLTIDGDILARGSTGVLLGTGVDQRRRRCIDVITSTPSARGGPS